MASGLKWTCACKKVRLGLEGAPVFHIHCFCDDCFVRTKAAQAQESEIRGTAGPSENNKMTSEDALSGMSFWGTHIKVEEGKEFLQGYRTGVKSNGTVGVADTTTTMNVLASCCGTLAYAVPKVPGFCLVCVGPELERLSGAAKDAGTLPPPMKILAKYCSVTNVPAPADAASAVPMGLLSIFGGAFLCPWNKPGRGDGELVQLVAPGATEWNGKTVRYFSLEDMKAAGFPFNVQA